MCMHCHSGENSSKKCLKQSKFVDKITKIFLTDFRVVFVDFFYKSIFIFHETIFTDVEQCAWCCYWGGILMTFICTFVGFKYLWRYFLHFSKAGQLRLFVAKIKEQCNQKSSPKLFASTKIKRSNFLPIGHLHF